MHTLLTSRYQVQRKDDEGGRTKEHPTRYFVNYNSSGETSDEKPRTQSDVYHQLGSLIS